MITNIYLNSSKERMYETGVKLGLSGDALNLFCYCCNEVKLEIDVDINTGSYNINKIDGKNIQ